MKPTRRLKRASFFIFYAIFLLLVAEVSARAFWKTRGVPFFAAHRSIQWSFYPALLGLERNPSVDEEDCFDVLMLGGSVLNTDYGDIEHGLRERLARATRACVRIYNLSAPAHTSLDSYYKYRHLKNRSRGTWRSVQRAARIILAKSRGSDSSNDAARPTVGKDDRLHLKPQTAHSSYGS